MLLRLRFCVVFPGILSPRSKIAILFLTITSCARMAPWLFCRFTRNSFLSFMKTTSTTFANQLDGRTSQQGRASGFASAPTCSLSQVVWVVFNFIPVRDDHFVSLSFSLSGTLDGAGGLSRYGAISRRAAKGAEPQRRGKRRRFFNTKITENTKNTKC